MVSIHPATNSARDTLVKQTGKSREYFMHETIPLSCRRLIVPCDCAREPSLNAPRPRRGSGSPSRILARVKKPHRLEVPNFCGLGNHVNLLFCQAGRSNRVTPEPSLPSNGGDCLDPMPEWLVFFRGNEDSPEQSCKKGTQPSLQASWGQALRFHQPC